MGVVQATKLTQVSYAERVMVEVCKANPGVMKYRASLMEIQRLVIRVDRDYRKSKLRLVVSNAA